MQFGDFRPYNIIVPNPATDWIIRRVFEAARDSGRGRGWLTELLNADPDIPPELKLFKPCSISYWLQNDIYYGTLIWPRVATDIINDTRVEMPVPVEQQLRIPEFCEPLVTEELFQAVAELRERRSRPFRQAHQARPGNDKLIRPVTPGIAVKYPLSGMIYCGHCSGSMTASSSRAYMTKDLEEKRYTAYVCRGYLDRACENGRRIPEDWLREMVIGSIRKHLWPADAKSDMPPSAGFIELCSAVRDEFECLVAAEMREAPALQGEMQELQERMAGWRISLANSRLASALRADIERDYEHATTRVQEIENSLASEDVRRQCLSSALNSPLVDSRLQQLHNALTGDSPTLINLQLTFHIDAIKCYSDAQVVMKTCKLGTMPEAITLIGRQHYAATALPDVVEWRRRGARRLGTLTKDAGELKSAAFQVGDPSRFAGLDEQWFWVDRFQVPQQIYWPEKHAREVAEWRLANAASMQVLVQHFGKTPPTLRKALQIAKETYGVDALGREVSRPNKPYWARDNAARVAEFMRQPDQTIKAAAAYFAKSEPTIGKALKFALEPRSASPVAD